MGVLRDHDLQRYINLGYTILAETGAGTGTAIAHASGFKGFKAIYSCDIDKDQIRLLYSRFSNDSRITLIPTDSETYLHTLLKVDIWTQQSIIKKDDKVVWFLDSHYPGFDLNKAAIDAEPNLDIRLPLHRELHLLHFYGRVNDVIICDDLRIFEKGPYGSRNMDEIGYGHAAAYDRPLPLACWEATHYIVRDYRDSGYLILEPHALRV